MSYTQTLPTATQEDGTLDVVSKFNTLTETALGIDSIYMRAKDTFKELLDGSKLTGPQYAELASQFISQLATTTTQQVLQGAMQWAQQEKELAYSLAKIEADTALTMANRMMVGYQIDKIIKEIDATCKQSAATMATSIRDNGRIETYAADGCTPLTLMNEGTKWDQKAVYQAQAYAALSDAYRKSGVVQIGTDGDGTIKGLSGTSTGYTDAQDKYARRQILSFEDSKRSHAVNALSQTIGQLLATDIVPDQATIINKFNAAIDYLNSNTPAV
jgi:hypothetical protein